MMVLGAKLHLLAWVWAAVVAVLVIASICLHLGMWREWRKRSGGFWRGKTAAFYVMLVLIGIQLYFVAALQENGSADAAYYVGSVTTNLATDSISSFDPYTGKALDFFNIRYVFSMYPAANAVLCRLTGLHPLVVTKVILCMMTVVFKLSRLCTDRKGAVKRKTDGMGAPVLYQCCESEFSYDLFECVVPADEGIRGKGRIVQYHPPVSVLSWPAHVSGEKRKESLAAVFHDRRRCD